MSDREWSAADDELVAAARMTAREFCPSEQCTAGTVAAALTTVSGHLYTGVCVDMACSIGFCAEHAAVAEMLKARESEIAAIVAVNERGEIMPPCGRCRELLWQVDSRNSDTRVLVGPGEVAELRALLPRPAY